MEDVWNVLQTSGSAVAQTEDNHVKMVTKACGTSKNMPALTSEENH